jgi:ABC-type dipeptide/oligopeptide/nickel transport system permease subunit
MGVLAAVAGIIVTARGNAVDPNEGIGAELRVISAVIIGGASLSGGRGTILGSFLGLLLMQVITTGLIFVDVPPESQQVAVGLVLILAATIDRAGSSFGKDLVALLTRTRSKKVERIIIVLLIVILAAFDWVGLTYYLRGEFYREKAKDYVGAAIATGVSEAGVMLRHILPNALTPVVSFAPFVIVANIGALVALDFLGFGLPAPTPSWGELIGQGMENLTKWWLVLFPLSALFVTLLLVVFIGEAVREAFDPKEFSQLR